MTDQAQKAQLLAGACEATPTSLTSFRWALSMHDNAETDEGTIEAASLEDATSLALRASQIEDEPDHFEAGLVTWASQAGATTLTVVPIAETGAGHRRNEDGSPIDDCPRCDRCSCRGGRATGEGCDYHERGEAP